MSKTIEEKVKEFDGLFMNNGTNGVLSDEFQDPKMVLVKKYFVDKLTTQKQALIAEVEAVVKEILTFIPKSYVDMPIYSELEIHVKQVAKAHNINLEHHEK